MIKATPYLMYDGQCAEAMAFYAKALGGEVTMQMRYSDAPDGMKDTTKDGERLMHAQVKLRDGAEIMGADSNDERPYHGTAGFSISLEYPDVAGAEAAFKALGEGGKVHMPMHKTFWSPAFGALSDKFGIPWMVSCTNPFV